ncbi:MAG: alternative ribosome rescue aminoacyl-tRNA hydrolase ArfB [Marmoricola sp.]
MTDLYVPAGPGIPDGLVIPEGELLERFSRSSGPGGQSVNTTDSRVELVFDPAASSVLDERQRQRLGGPVRIVATEHRSQHRNRMAARDRLADIIRERLAPPPPPRVPTKPSKSSQRRRVDAKRRRGEIKAGRRRVGEF